MRWTNRNTESRQPTISRVRQAVTTRCIRPVIEALEGRQLLSTNFANISYADPFPEPTVAGEYVHSSSTVAVDQPGLRTSGSSDLVLPLPSSLANGVAGITIEFSLKLAGPDTGGQVSGTLIKGPGFHVRAISNASTNGVFQTGIVHASKGGKFLQTDTTYLPVRKGSALANEAMFRLDGKWHHYTITSDSNTIRVYIDGELTRTMWMGTMGTQVGPMSNGTNVRTENNVTLGRLVGSNGASGEFKNVRVSTVELSSTQVMQNFEKLNKAAVLFASPTGTAGAAGTRVAPLSLSAAMGQAGANKRIVLLPGTYNGADFQLNNGGSDALNPLLITGDDGASQVIIATTGTTTATLSGIGFVRIQNITFRGDTSSALRITNANGRVVLDGVRFTSNANGLVVTGSKEVLVQNSIFSVPGTAMSFDADGAVLRNNTIVGGSVGVNFNSANTFSMANNLFSGVGTGYVSNPSAFVTSALNYNGWNVAADGNNFNPSTGGYVARINNVNYTAAQFDTLKQYWFNAATADPNAEKQTWNRRQFQGYMNDLRSMLLSPTFANAGSGDFRLASTLGNPINAGVSRVFARDNNWLAYGISAPPTTDATGAPRIQGAEVDVGAFEAAGPHQATFTLSSAAKTSAGIYDSSGKLIRTLWSGRQTPAGTVVVDWNGLNDLNQPVATGTYTAKLLANNVEYVFEGLVGNNSSSPYGQRVLGDFYTPLHIAMVPNSTSAYFTVGFNEGRFPIRRFDTTDPTGADKVGSPNSDWRDSYPGAIATDGVKLYFVRERGGPLAISRFDVATGAKENVGINLDYYPTGPELSGLAVQTGGNLLFVANKTENKVYVYNKNTFASVASFSVPNIKRLATMPNGDLWVISGTKIVRYTNLTSSTPTVVREITGFSNPMGLAVSQDGNLVAVADGGASQQVKAYNTGTGALAWTLGQAGGYANGPDITTNKFILSGAIAFGKDGDIWVQDDASFRLLHFNSSRTYINNLGYIPHSYKTTVDQNNSTRVFASFTEYRVDYSKPLIEGQGWTPVKYWGYGLPSAFYDRYALNGTAGDSGFNDVVTLSNGRTYAVTDWPDSGTSGDNNTRIFELTATGTRVTNVLINRWNYWDKQGTLQTADRDTTAGVVRFRQATITGFASNGDPIYSAYTQVATAPYVNNWMGSDPYGPYVKTSSNLLVTLNQDWVGGFHMGAVTPGATQWTWKSNRSVGPYSGDGGTFETFAQRGANRLMVDGRNLIYGYHGEFWQNRGQATQFVHYLDNGLAVGQFGTPIVSNLTGNDGLTTNGISGAAGNAYNPILTRGTDGKLYMYVNDESGRSNIRWRIDNLNTVNEMSATLSAGAPTAPVSPSSLSATAVSSSQINLSWTDNSSNETGFRIERATDSGFTQNVTPVATVGANTTSYSNTGLAASTTYYYRVRATNAAGDSANSNVSNATTQAASTVPSAPSGLSATAVSSSQINLSWTDNSTNETGFKIERATNSTFTQNLTLVTTTAAGVTIYSNTGLAASTTYYYRIRATNATGDSANSVTASATTPAAVTIPAAPSGLSATAVSSSQINLSWTDNSSNETGFKIERATDSSFTQNLSLVTTTAAGVTSYSNAGLAASTTYYYRVRATNSAGDSANTSTASATTPAAVTIPAAPSGLSATAASSSQINLAWTDNSSNETGFEIERATDAAFTENLTLVVTTSAGATSYSNAGLAASTTYYYRVRAVNAVGASANSASASATTGAPSSGPLSFDATAITSFTWGSGPTYTAGSGSVFGGGWYNVSGTPTLRQTASPPSGYSLSFPAAGGVVKDNTARIAKLDLSAAGVSDVPTNARAQLTSSGAVSASLTVNIPSGQTGKVYVVWGSHTDNSTAGAKLSVSDGITTINSTIESSLAFTLTYNANHNSRVSTFNVGSGSRTLTITVNDNGTADRAYLQAVWVETDALPAAPSGLSAAAVSPSQIDLSWTDNSNSETGFKIERATDAAFTQNVTLITTTDAGETSYSDIGLSSSTTYYYRVRATNASGDSANSDIASATTGASLPAAPSGLSASASSTSQINLSWTDNSGNETGFVVERALNAAFTIGAVEVTTTSANATSYSDTGLDESTTYYYRVRAVNSSGESANSPVASATTPTAVPSAPTGLSATAVSPSQINLTWTDASNNETGFEVERATDAAFTQNVTLVATILANATSYINGGLIASTTYYYRVRAVNSAGASANSSSANATTPAAIPAAPSGLSATAVSSSQINLSWADNSGNETGFRIERATDSGFTQNLIQVATAAANATSYSDSGLSASTAYYYRVRATNAAGDSSNSNTATATTQGPGVTIPNAPTNLSATAVSAYQVNLSWTDNSNNETGFKIERATDGGFTQNVIVVATTASNTTTYSDSGLNALTTYFYRVRATNAAGDSSNSLSATAVTGAPSEIFTGSADIGAPSPEGSSSYNSSTGVYTINAGGADIYYGSDEFHYLHTSLTGDGTMIARVTGVQNTNAWAKAGIMVRNSLTAGSRNALVAITPGNGATWQQRQSDGGSTAWGNQLGHSAPYWVKLTRSGNTFTASISPDGQTWTQLGSSVVMSIGSTAYWGLAVTSHADGTLNTSTFDNVQIFGLPAAPSGLSATAVSSSQINLGWTDNSNNENGFEIERATNSSFTQNLTVVATVGTNVTSFSNTGLAASTTYYYRVRAINVAGSSANTSAASATTPSGDTAPVAPSGLSATAVSSSQINLTWTDNSTNETGFKIERATDAAFTQNLTSVATTSANATGYSNTGLAASTTYYYRVRATNAAGDSTNSSSANATTASAGTPVTYQAENATLGGGTVSANYHPGYSGTGYADFGGNGSYADFSVTRDSAGTVDLAFRFACGGTNTRTCDVVVNGVTVGSIVFDMTGSWEDWATATLNNVALPAGTSTVRLIAVVSGGPNVDWMEVTPMSSAPAAPSGLSATAVSSSQINLTWTDNSNNENGFKIERATDSGFTQNLTVIATVSANATSYNNTGLTASTTYYYRVRATNAAGDSANSSVASATTATTAPAAPSGLSATAVSTSQINLTWTDNSSNETGFVIERALNAAFTSDVTQVATTLANATSYGNTGLNASTTYYYRVRAINAAGGSANAGVVSATTHGQTATAYEAEAGTRTGNAAVVNDGAASGGQKVSFGNNSADSLTFSNINGGAGGTATITFRYAAVGANPVRALKVNGVSAGSVTFSATPNWSSFAIVTATVTLAAGSSNSIQLLYGGDLYGLHVDKIDVVF